MMNSQNCQPKIRQSWHCSEQEFERDGGSAIKRLAEKDPLFYFRIMECLNPKAVRDAIEDAVIDAGLTNADIGHCSARPTVEFEYGTGPRTRDGLEPLAAVCGVGCYDPK